MLLNKWDKKILKKQLLIRRKASDEDRQIKCVFCDEMFTKNQVRRHQWQKYEEPSTAKRKDAEKASNLTFKCVLCDYTFTQKNVKLHHGRNMKKQVIFRGKILIKASILMRSLSLHFQTNIC